MNWRYQNSDFTDDMIPEGAVGFIYYMESIIDEKAVCYIGKKNFCAQVKTKLSKKNLSSDKRLKTYKRVKKCTYHTYFSSNDVLKQAHKDGVYIRRTILEICFSKTELSYKEVKLLFQYDVLKDPRWLNSNIAGKWYKAKIMK